MLEILNHFIYNKKNSKQIKIIADQILNELDELFISKQNKIKTWRLNSDLKKVSKDNFVFSSQYKTKTMGKILKFLKEDDFSEDYNESINKIRNKFAHAILETDPKTDRQFFKKGNTTFDEALCKKIRKDIIRHDKNLKLLALKVSE